MAGRPNTKSAPTACVLPNVIRIGLDKFVIRGDPSNVHSLSNPPKKTLTDDQMRDLMKGDYNELMENDRASWVTDEYIVNRSDFVKGSRRNP